MPDQIRFSIATPIGAFHPLLRHCFESLRLQRTPMSVSLLDASGDPCVAKLIEEFKDVASYRRHGPDDGQAAAIREGWDHGDGEVLGWLNADDLLFPRALESVAARFAADPSVDVVHGHSAICDERMRMTGYHWAVSSAGEDLAKGCNISQPSCFFRRRAYDAAGGLDASLHYTMDWDLWLRLQAHGARFAFIGEPLSAVFWGAGTKTSGFNAARRRELSRLIDRYAPAKLRSKVFRGFAVQAALDALRPAVLQQAVRHAFLRNRRRVFGVGPDGSVDGIATITWFHLQPAPASSLRIACSGLNEVDVRASRAVASVDRTPREVVVRFAADVAAGETVSVELKKRAPRSWRFHGAEWA